MKLLSYRVIGLCRSIPNISGCRVFGIGIPRSIYVVILLSGLGLSLLLSGCVVRSYPVTKDRVDQDLSGNRGYLQGSAPAPETKARKTTRTTQAIEIEVRSPIKFERLSKAPAQKTTAVERIEPVSPEGNRGYLMQSVSPEIEALLAQSYVVKKGDTLQKISKKFYGTSKKWGKIYEANKGILKGPDKVYPGQTISIPVEPVKPAPEIKENLK